MVCAVGHQKMVSRNTEAIYIIALGTFKRLNTFFILGNCETGVKNEMNCASLTMQHRPIPTTLQLVAAYKTLKYSVLCAAGCTVSVYAFVRRIYFLIIL